MLEDIDSPRVVIARVMDVRGALLRLGFKEYTSRREETVYRLHVLLPDGGVPARYGFRNISHVRLSVSFTSPDAILTETWRAFGASGYMRLAVAFGYPTRRLRRNKITESFEHLTGGDFHESLSIDSDHQLLQAEHRLARFITGIAQLRLKDRKAREAPHDKLQTQVKSLFVATLRDTSPADLIADKRAGFCADFVDADFAPPASTPHLPDDRRRAHRRNGCWPVGVHGH